eukprot:1134856-Lingulodinium_polyedra.AAC.1
MPRALSGNERDPLAAVAVNVRALSRKPGDGLPFLTPTIQSDAVFVSEVAKLARKLLTAALRKTSLAAESV